MILLRTSAQRGCVVAADVESRHAFSFGGFHDPQWTGFGALRVAKEVRLAPGAALPSQRLANMEVLTWVLAGALSPCDSPGCSSPDCSSPLRAGGLRWIGAGHGIEHAQANASASEPAHCIQFWIQPDRVNAVPACAQVQPETLEPAQGWTLLASPDGAAGSVAIRQQAWLHHARVRGQPLAHAPTPGRRQWLQVTHGNVRVQDQWLHAGDAMGLVDEHAALVLEGEGDVLLWELPG